MTTIAAFRAAMHGLSVTGVTRNYDHMPFSIGDVPAKLIGPASSERDAEYASFSSSVTSTFGIGEAFSLQIIICIEAAGQSKPDVEQDAIDTMQDALRSALHTYAAGQNALRISYTTQGGSHIVGELAYYAVIADVTALTFS